jgi:hypothetical protein
MYRNSLFSRGAKHITKFQLRTGNNPSPSFCSANHITKFQLRTGNNPSPALYSGRGMKCGAGIDDYLLSLVSGIGRMSVKQKKK